MIQRKPIKRINFPNRISFLVAFAFRKLPLSVGVKAQPIMSKNYTHITPEITKQIWY